MGSRAPHLPLLHHPLPAPVCFGGSHQARMGHGTVASLYGASTAGRGLCSSKGSFSGTIGTPRLLPTDTASLPDVRVTVEDVGLFHSAARHQGSCLWPPSPLPSRTSGPEQAWWWGGEGVQSCFKVLWSVCRDPGAGEMKLLLFQTGHPTAQPSPLRALGRARKPEGADRVLTSQERGDAGSRPEWCPPEGH